MTCSRALRLMHLNREGELRESLRIAVLRHVSTCNRCALEMTRIDQSNDVLASLRVEKPVLHNPESLTQVIMESIGPGPFAVRSRHWSFPWHLQPALRFACGVLVASFFMQTGFDAWRMSELDARLAQVRPPSSQERTANIRTIEAHRNQIQQMYNSTNPFANSIDLGPFKLRTLFDHFHSRYPSLCSAIEVAGRRKEHPQFSSDEVDVLTTLHILGPINLRTYEHE